MLSQFKDTSKVNNKTRSMRCACMRARVIARVEISIQRYYHIYQMRKVQYTH